jgi:hypothetical protein
MRALAEILLRGPNTLSSADREIIATYTSSQNDCHKLKSLLNIAGHVQQGGKHVTAEDIACAHNQGATDTEIHDTVLIAAAFCMYNRYVDGLATWAPQEQEAYIPMGARMAHEGYVSAPVQDSAAHPEAVTV